MPGERRRWASCRSSATNRHHPHSSHDVFQRAPESRWHLRAPRKTSTAQFLESQHAKAPGAKPLPQKLGLQLSTGSQNSASSSSTCGGIGSEGSWSPAQEASISSCEQQGRRRQACVCWSNLRAGNKGERWTGKTVVPDFPKYSGYCQREMAVQARMVERETKMQENNVNQEKVTEEMNRWKQCWCCEKIQEEKTLLDEFAAFDHKPSEKHQEFTSLQHEDVAKQKEIRREEGNFARAWGTLSEPAGE